MHSHSSDDSEKIKYNLSMVEIYRTANGFKPKMEPNIHSSFKDICDAIFTYVASVLPSSVNCFVSLHKFPDTEQFDYRFVTRHLMQNVNAEDVEFSKEEIHLSFACSSEVDRAGVTTHVMFRDQFVLYEFKKGLSNSPELTTFPQEEFYFIGTITNKDKYQNVEIMDINLPIIYPRDKNCKKYLVSK